MKNIKRKTHEQFLIEMSQNHPTLIVLDKYKNGRTKVNLECSVCGYRFGATPGSLYMKHGCPKCSGSLKKSTSEFIEELRIVNDSITVLGNYKNSKTEIMVSCNKCGHKWGATPNSLLSGKGCRVCAGTMPKSHEQFITEMKQKHPTVNVIGNYINNREKVECKCMVCGKTFYGIPHAMIDMNHDCPYCSMSQGERAISNWLDNNGFVYCQEYRFADCKDINQLPFDFYIPSINTVIEYDGVQHFKVNQFFGGKKAFDKLKIHDKIKDNYCSKNGINILRISFYDYKNINEILTNKLTN